MKTFLICFNATRGNRDKFFEVLCESEGLIKVNSCILQFDGSKSSDHPAYNCYVIVVECSKESFSKLEDIKFSGFCSDCLNV